MRHRSRTLDIQTPRVFVPLLKPARNKGAHGGRGSGKSFFFAGLAVDMHLAHQGRRTVCIREVQKSLKESAKLLIEDQISRMDVADHFNVRVDEIRTPGDGLIIFRGMQDYSAETIKSLEGFDCAWCEEAQTLSAKSLELLRPTIRRPNSELWFSWNRRSPSDPVDDFLIGQKPENSVVVKADWRDNPFFPDVLAAEREHDRAHNRHRYAHIWEGEYEPAVVGAIWDRTTINQYRISELPELERIVVGVDPAVSSDAGSDMHGIVVAGLAEKRGYVLEDASMRGNPRQWAVRAIAMYDKWEADAIVIEINQGGDMVRHTLQTVRPGIRVVEVRATKGKHVRAEPIAALYQTGQVSHAGTFPGLEDQMCATTASGYEGPGSPDAMDAAVWALTELFPRVVRRKMPQPSLPSGHMGHVDGGWMA